MQWLDKLGFSYVAKDIEADKEAYEELMAKLGGNFQGVPVTDIAGDVVLGFDRPKNPRSDQESQHRTCRCLDIRNKLPLT